MGALRYNVQLLLQFSTLIKSHFTLSADIYKLLNKLKIIDWVAPLITDPPRPPTSFSTWTEEEKKDTQHVTREV